MKKEYSIDLEKFSLKRERRKRITNWAFLSISILTFGLYYTVFGLETLNATIFFLASFLVILFLVHRVFRKGLQNSDKQWHSYKIIIADNGLFCEFSQPIINEFQKDSWIKKQLKIDWENLRIIQGANIILYDKSISKFERLVFNKGKIIIPNELEKLNELVKNINSIKNAIS